MSDSFVFSLVDLANTGGGVAADMDAQMPVVGTQGGTKAKKARKGAKTKTKANTKFKYKPSSASDLAVVPATLRKSASWRLAQLDVAVHVSINAAFDRTRIESIPICGYWVLKAIIDGSDMVQAELSTLSGMDRSDVIRLIDSLESANLVERTRDTKDRHRQFIVLMGTGDTTRALLRCSLRRAGRAAVVECVSGIHALLASPADDFTTGPKTDSSTPPSGNADAKKPETAISEATATETDTRGMAESKTQTTSSGDAQRPKWEKSKKKKHKEKNKKGSSR